MKYLDHLSQNMLFVTMATVFKSYVIYRLVRYVDAAQKYSNVMGRDAKLSKTANEMLASPSLVDCALKCELRSDCQAYNLRPNSSSINMKICDLYYHKEPDIVKYRESENGSVYFEKVVMFFF